MGRAAILLIACFFIASVSGESVYRQDPIWGYRLGGKVNSLAPLGNAILIGSESGLYLLDYNKALEWYHPTDEPVTSVSAHKDRIIASSSDGMLLLLDKTGKLVWDRRIPGYVGYDKALAADDGGILCGSMDGFVYMLDWKGTYLWKHLVGSYVTNVGIIRDNIIVVSDRQVYLLDPDGKVKRNLDIKGYIRSSAIGGDMVVVGMDDGVVRAYDLNGTALWANNLSENIGPMDMDGNITVGTKERHLTMLGSDGKLYWKLNVSDSVIAVASSPEFVLVGTMDNKVHLYSIGGALRWYYGTEGRPNTLSIRDRDAVSGTNAGRIYYSRIPKKDAITSLMLSAAVIVILAAMLALISKSWR